MNKPPPAPVNHAKSIAWHSLEKEAVLAEVMASESGLSSAEAALRLTANGLNALSEARHISPWQILFSQYNSLIIWILIVAGVISGVVGETRDAIAILVSFVVLKYQLSDSGGDFFHVAIMESTKPGFWSFFKVIFHVIR